MSGTTDLSRLFEPRSIALVGASDRAGSIGGYALQNLAEHSTFTGDLYLINPRREAIGERRCWPSVAALPATPDVALIAVPASEVMAALHECADRGVAFAIVFTSGFGETGDEGKALEAEMRAIVARSGMRIYGPNCPGLTNVNRRLGLTFSPAFKLDLLAGPIGIATQGGGLGRCLLQSMQRGIGVGLWSSAGNEVDLEVSDFIDHMAGAGDVGVIATLLEGVRDGRKFLRAVRHAAAQRKPVVALKIGRSEYGRRAAQSHTASIAGSAEVNSAVLRQMGVVEVDDIDELIDTAALFARARPGANEKVAVVCSSGGTAALSADMIGSAGLELATLSPATLAELAKHLPPFVSAANPLDTSGEILNKPEALDATLRAVANDPAVGLVLYPIPLEYGPVTKGVADSIVRVQRETGTPIVAVWMSDRLGAGYDALVAGGLMPMRSVGKAVKAMSRWVWHGQWRARADAMPAPEPLWLLAGQGQALPDVSTEPLAKHWLTAHGMAVPAHRVARTPHEAQAAARELGWPVVAKVVSAEVAHKSDAGGVAVGVRDAEELARVWERIHADVTAAVPHARIDGLLIEAMAPPGGVETLVGVHTDDSFGPVISVGLGGIHVEVLKDVSRRLLPITLDDARDMLRELRGFPILQGIRGRAPRDIEAIARTLVAVSDLVSAHRGAVAELEINPLWVGAVGQGVLALDALAIRAGDAP